MFLLVGMLPGGVLDADLEGIWGEGLVFGRAFMVKTSPAPETKSGATSPAAVFGVSPVGKEMVDNSDAASVCSLDSIGTMVTLASVASSHTFTMGHHPPMSGILGRASGVWKDHMTPLLQASLVEKSQKLLPQSTEASYVRWLSVVEGWDPSAMLADGGNAVPVMLTRKPPLRGRPAGAASAGSSFAARAQAPVAAALSTAAGRMAFAHFSQFPFIADFAASLAGPGWWRAAVDAGVDASLLAITPEAVDAFERQRGSDTDLSFDPPSLASAAISIEDAPPVRGRPKEAPPAPPPPEVDALGTPPSLIETSLHDVDDATEVPAHDDDRNTATCVAAPTVVVVGSCESPRGDTAALAPPFVEESPVNHSQRAGTLDDGDAEPGRLPIVPKPLPTAKKAKRPVAALPGKASAKFSAVTTPPRLAASAPSSGATSSTPASVVVALGSAAGITKSPSTERDTVVARVAGTSAKTPPASPSRFQSRSNGQPALQRTVSADGAEGSPEHESLLPLTGSATVAVTSAPSMMHAAQSAPLTSARARRVVPPVLPVKQKPHGHADLAGAGDRRTASPMGRLQKSVELKSKKEATSSKDVGSDSLQKSGPGRLEDAKPVAPKRSDGKPTGHVRKVSGTSAEIDVGALGTASYWMSLPDDVFKYGSSEWRFVSASGSFVRGLPAALTGKVEASRVVLRLSKASLPAWMSEASALRCEILMKTIVHFRYVAEWMSHHLGTYTADSQAVYDLLEMESGNMWCCLDRSEEVLKMCGFAEFEAPIEEEGEEDNEEDGDDDGDGGGELAAGGGGGGGGGGKGDGTHGDEKEEPQASLSDAATGGGMSMLRQDALMARLLPVSFMSAAREAARNLVMLSAWFGIVMLCDDRCAVCCVSAGSLQLCCRNSVMCAGLWTRTRQRVWVFVSQTALGSRSGKRVATN